MGWIILSISHSFGKEPSDSFPLGLWLLATAGLFFWLATPYFRAKLATIGNYVPGTGSVDRPTLWRDSLGIFLQHPFIGAGMGSFISTYPTYQSLPSDLITEHAHNDYLEALTETGLIGEALIVIALMLSIPVVFRNLGSELKYEQRWIQ